MYWFGYLQVVLIMSSSGWRRLQLVKDDDNNIDVDDIPTFLHPNDGDADIFARQLLGQSSRGETMSESWDCKWNIQLHSNTN